MSVADRPELDVAPTRAPCAAGRPLAARSWIKPLAIPRQLSQLANRPRRNEARAPEGRLAGSWASHSPSLTSVLRPGTALTCSALTRITSTVAFEDVVDGLPIHAGRFNRGVRAARFGQPRGQLQQRARRRAERPDHRRPVRPRAGRPQHATTVLACTSRPQHRSYSTCMAPPLWPGARGVTIKNFLGALAAERRQQCGVPGNAQVRFETSSRHQSASSTFTRPGRLCLYRFSSGVGAAAA